MLAKGALEIQSGSLRLANHEKKYVFEDVRCSFWCPQFFSERQSVRLLTAGMLTQKKGLQLLFLFVEFERRILYEKSLPSLQGRLCRSITCCYTSTCRGEITPSGTIYLGPSCTQWFPPPKETLWLPVSPPAWVSKVNLRNCKATSFGPSGPVADRYINAVFSREMDKNGWVSLGFLSVDLFYPTWNW